MIAANQVLGIISFYRRKLQNYLGFIYHFLFTYLFIETRQVFSRIMKSGSKFVMEGVKNLAFKTKVSITTASIFVCYIDFA